MNEYGDAIVLHTPDWIGIIDVFVDEGCFTKIEKEKEKEETEEIEEAEEEEEEEEIVDDDDDDGNGNGNCNDNGDVENGDEKEDDDGDNKDKDKDTELPIPIRKHDDGKKDVIPDDIDRVIHMEDKVLPSILDIRVCGVEGVKDIFFEKRKEEWIITTEGSNLYQLFANPLIDKTRSMSNDMWEIYEIFGIEAARQFLIEEYMDIVSSDGTFVNASNVELLVDIMVYTGTIISISRYGQKKVGCGPMAKASFEESLENFLKAGVNGEKESANGVSASIMLGKMPNIGTGVFDLLVDVPKLLAMNIGKDEKVENTANEKNSKNENENKDKKENKERNTIPEIPSKSIFQKF
jgi:DNA-directed RNA polymerase beta' subunit